MINFIVIGQRLPNIFPREYCSTEIFVYCFFFFTVKRKIFKSVICTHRPCSKLPLFRRCGSNQTDHSNPRTFRNGCRQCATSCKAVLAGKRRYERLHMDKCYQNRKREFLTIFFSMFRFKKMISIFRLACQHMG